MDMFAAFNSVGKTGSEIPSFRFSKMFGKMLKFI